MNFAQILVAVVLTSDGSVDEVATLEGAAIAVEKTRAEVRELAESVRLQFSAHMDDSDGEGASKPKVQKLDFFVNGVVGRMNATPENYGRLVETVHAFLEANKEGNCAKPLFRVKRGKGGGVERIL